VCPAAASPSLQGPNSKRRHDRDDVMGGEKQRTSAARRILPPAKTRNDTPNQHDEEAGRKPHMPVERMKRNRARSGSANGGLCASDRIDAPRIRRGRDRSPSSGRSTVPTFDETACVVKPGDNRPALSAAELPMVRRPGFTGSVMRAWLSYLLEGGSGRARIERANASRGG